MGTDLDNRMAAINNTLFINFIKAWSIHAQHEQTQNCSVALNYDSNWKISRLKCCFDHIYTTSEEFGEIKIGCMATPERGSYFCSKHKTANLLFLMDGKVLEIDPATFVHSTKGN